MRIPARVASLLLLCGLARPAAAADDGLGLAPGQRLLAPITYRQLTVFPVVQTAAAVDHTQYLTLSEGLERKLVTVSEVGAGGEVNRLAVHNRSDRPLLILAGEVVLGGQQDRILGRDTIIPAHEDTQVQVFCVEHGRWSGARQFTAAEGMADTKIRQRAKFDADQSAVWAEVAKKNAAHGAAPATGTYRNLAAGAEGKRALDPYRAAIGAKLARLPEAGRIAGVVAAINGRVSSIELFARPELFAAYRDKLLDSIYMGASDVVAVEGATPPAPAAVGEFLRKARSAPKRTVASDKGGAVTDEQRSDDVGGSALRPTPAAAPVYENFELLH